INGLYAFTYIRIESTEMNKNTLLGNGYILRELTSSSNLIPEILRTMPPYTMIRLLRTKQKITQVQLAQKTGLPQSYIANIEAGKVDIRLNTLKKIFNALSCDLLLLPKPLKNFGTGAPDACSVQTIPETQARPVDKNPSGHEERKIVGGLSSKVWVD
ncbi:helix-turn-helix domain-containing protein, partial [Elusimicrobiota bacterium]